MSRSTALSDNDPTALVGSSDQLLPLPLAVACGLPTVPVAIATTDSLLPHTTSAGEASSPTGSGFVPISTSDIDTKHSPSTGAGASAGAFSLATTTTHANGSEYGSTPLLRSLPEAHSTIDCPEAHDDTRGSNFRKCFAFMGPGLLVAVGYMDPGNWATDLAAGSQYGYSLLYIVLLSNFAAMLLQFLSLKLGIAAERDLAQACRAYCSPRVCFALWILCEIAIAACDLAEVIGSAIAFNLLFGLPLWAGVIITALDVLFILLLEQKSFRWFEVLIGVLTLLIAVCFGYELAVSRPDGLGVLRGMFVPSEKLFTDSEYLYIAIGIIGATVMPHNLYLHSSIVQTRAYARNAAGKAMAIKFSAWDSTISLFFAFTINAAILMLSAAAFHGTENDGVADIREAASLLSPTLGHRAASVLFAVALLASGQNSTLTGTLAGQITMEGFVSLSLAPWKRRVLTRGLAIVPAVIVAAAAGDSAVAQLLVLSQVILSLQLSFAVVPLVMFTSREDIMTPQFVNSQRMKIAAWTVTAIIIALNLFLLGQTLVGAVTG